MVYTSFKDMSVWKKAHELSVDVFRISVDLPRSEDYGMTSQLRHSSNSVSANISEAFGRSTSKDKSKFYIIARGSAFETQNHLVYGNAVGYFEETETNDLSKRYLDLIFEINKILKSLPKSQPQSQPQKP